MNLQYDSQDAHGRTLRGPKILLIEDNLDQQRIIQLVLQACMPQVELLIAATPHEAIHQLEECTHPPSSLPRLILLDLYLPGREEGWTVLEALKRPTSPFRLIPVTLLSQSGKPEDVQTGYQLGANSYVVKPNDYPQWQAYFESLREYWLHTVTLPHS